MLKLADVADLDIVCGEHNIGSLPEVLSLENEIVLRIKRIVNHPKYTQENGPINGYDISVYQVDDSPLVDLVLPATNLLDPRQIYPICLPRQSESDYQSTKGILTGWRDPRPQYFSQGNQQDDQIKYRKDNILLRQVQMEKVACEDPAWMNSSTYYPQGLDI